MRFLAHEHADMTAALRAHGIDAVQVLFVKRRGRLHAELPDRSDAFVFYRKKTSELDEHGRWRDCVNYFIGMDNKTPCDWPAVLRSFTDWLARG